MMIKLKGFIKCQQGATAIEYVLIAAGVALAIMVAIFAFGDQLAELVQWMVDALPV